MGLLNALGLKWIGWNPRPVRESLQPDDDSGWLRASLDPNGLLLNRDPDSLHGEALLRAALDAYQNNPLAHAIVEQTTSFVLGGGAHIVAEDPRVQRVVDSFWLDRENHMPLRIYTIQTELSLYGEQFIRFFPDPITGRTLIRRLNPLHITAIQTHPQDHETPLRYLYSPPGAAWAPGFEGAQPLVEPKARNSADQLGVQGNNRALAQQERRALGGGGQGAASPGGSGQRPAAPLGGTWLPSAEVLHTTINKPSSSLRGRSDLAPILRYLRYHTKWVKDRLTQNEVRNTLVWDVTLQGAGVSEINAMRARYGTPPPTGSVLFHNESESWKPVNPQIHADDASADGRAIRLMISTGAMIPEHYLGEGGNVNRATAAEMSGPATKRFQRKQEVFRALLTQVIDRVLDEAVGVGRLGPRINRSFKVQFEELTTSPLENVAAAVKDLTHSLALASEKGWVTPDEARRLWWRYAAQADESAPQSKP